MELVLCPVAVWNSVLKIEVLKEDNNNASHSC